MAYAKGVQWTEEKTRRLHELAIAGYKSTDIATILSSEFDEQITISSVLNAKYKNPIGNYLLETNSDSVEIFEADTLPMDDYMVSADYHAPYHSILWVNRLLMIAQLFEIRQNLLGGDLVDAFFASYFTSDNKPRADFEMGQTEPLLKALGYFERNYLIEGNHETRLSRATKAMLHGKHLMSLYGGSDEWKKSFVFSPYDKVFIGNEFMLVHPKSYSQITPQTARRLAEKYHRHIINTHGHIGGAGWDRSGKFQCCDMGGMFQKNKVEYISLHTTTHPSWANGFCMIRNGKLWWFNENTDWNFWSNISPETVKGI